MSLDADAVLGATEQSLAFRWHGWDGERVECHRRKLRVLLPVGLPPCQRVIHLLGPLREVALDLIVILDVVVVVGVNEEVAMTACRPVGTNYFSRGVLSIEVLLERGDPAIRLRLLQV